MNGQPSAPFSIGARVTSSGKVGTVRFIGTTQFSSGIWVGIELDQPTGKNDGSVQGVRYFNCLANAVSGQAAGAGGAYGLFVRPNAAKPLSDRSRQSLVSTPTLTPMPQRLSSPPTKRVRIDPEFCLVLF